MLKWVTQNKECGIIGMYDLKDGGIVMSILSGKGKVHIDGHKDLTINKPVKKIDTPKKVYIPLVNGTATSFDVLVQVDDHVDIGTKLAVRKDLYLPIYASVSGTVVGIEKRMHVSGRMQEHIVIENDEHYTHVKVLDVEDPDSLSSNDIVEAMKELGLVGLGGSGFPTYVKYNHVENIDTILINGVECEPLITADHKAMEENTEALFDGLRFMIKAANASKGIIAIKEHKPELFKKLQEYATKESNITCVEVKDRYPMGWEKTLVQEVLKKDFERLPSEVGVIVNNSSTAIALSKGIRNGEMIARRIVTLSGDGLKDPTNVEVTIGTPANYIIEQIGGYIDGDQEGIIINGGPMMGNSLMNDTFVVATYTNAINVLVRHNQVALPCLKCGMCIDHCPAHLQPVKIMQAQKAANVEMLEKLEVNRCVSCGMCSYICPSKIEVTDFVSKAKRRVQLANRKK